MGRSRRPIRILIDSQNSCRRQNREGGILCTSADEARSRGWEYYFDAITAQKFASTLQELDNIEEMTSKQQNTLYTFYRFEMDQIDTDKDHPDLTGIENPAYGKKLNGDPVVTFDLNDIRVWDEDSGDFDDDQAGGGLMTNKGYDDALYINIPVKALPVRTVTIDREYDMGTHTVSYHYSTNLQDPDDPSKSNVAALPLRVYYTVGLADDLTNADGEIDLVAGVNNEYLNKYKVTAATEKDFGLKTGDVVFYSNWYDENNTYNGYVSGDGKGYTYGDPAITFSPSPDNSYYIAQEPLPIYVLNNNVPGNPTTKRPDEILLDSKAAEEKLNQVATKVTKNVDEDGNSWLQSDFWYYVIAHYYALVEGDPSGKCELRYRAVPRRGSEFGSAILGEENAGEYLCWHDDASGNFYLLTEKPDKPNEPGDWHIALREGGLRTGDFAQNVRTKASNTTITAGNYYLPVVSSRSSAEAGGAIFNIYLGNNGRLWFSDRLLMVTKTVEASQEGGRIDNTGTYDYQVYVNGWTDMHTAVVLQYDGDDGRDRWMRQAHYIDLVLGNYMCLRDTNDVAARFDSHGNRVVSTEGGGWVYADKYENTGENRVNMPYDPTTEDNPLTDGVDAPYYLYLGKNQNETDLGSTERNIYRVMHTQHDGNESTVSAEEITASPHPDDPAYIDFYAVNPLLIPAYVYEEQWVKTDAIESPYTPDDIGISIRDSGDPPVLLVSISPVKAADGSSYEFQITSAYKTDSAYQTKELYFGTKEDGFNEDGSVKRTPLTGADLYDQSPNFAKNVNQTLDQVAGYTALFTLKHGEGLLLSSMTNGVRYRFTEKLTASQVAAGVGIKRIEHTTSSGVTQEYALGGVVPQSMRIDNNTHAYSVFGGVNEFERHIHYVNTDSEDKTETHINGSEIKDLEDPDDPDDPDADSSLKPRVKVGDTITYTIQWKNTANGPAALSVADPLDEGVDFVSASYGEDPYKVELTEETETSVTEGEAVAKDGAYSGNVTIRYYDANTDYTYSYVDSDDSQTKTKTMNHVVTWDFGTVGEGAHGTVTLTVRVNSKAKLYWDYDLPDPNQGGSQTRPPEGDDHLVRNRAEIHVAGNRYYTNIVQNPLDEPSKTETLIDHGQEGADDDLRVTEGDNLTRTEQEEGKPNRLDGPAVSQGDRITYRITWRNGANKAAAVTVRDVLDPNVRLLSATFNPSNIRPAVDAAYQGAKEATLTPAASGDDPNAKPEDATTQTAEPPGGTVEIPSEGAGSETVPIIRYFKETQNSPGPSAAIDPANPPYNVEWNLGLQAAGAEGYVELVVQVLPNATSAHWVVNSAYVAVDNEWAQTEDVYNPIPGSGKTELTPGEGKFVNEHEEITYRIAWKNTTGREADVIIADPLDNGVDFVAAAFDATVGADGKTVEWQDATLDPGGEVFKERPTGNPVTVALSDNSALASGNKSVTLQYIARGAETIKVEQGTTSVDVPAHAVVWKFRAATDGEGVVTLRVRVNERATVKWAYSDDAGSGGIGGSAGDGKDYEVVDRAVVSVDNEPRITNTVHNPVPEKEEIGDPGEGNLVGVGDTVTYEIGWNNGKNGTATVYITDPLDKGVTFKSASFDSMTLEDWELTPGTTTKTEKGADGNDITIQYDENTRTVKWALYGRKAHDSGTVKLAVTVNENAAGGWAYIPAEKDNAGGNETGPDDYEIVNRARVQVGNSFGYTAEIENPVPEKTEEKPGDGKMVAVGEEITYFVYWKNVHEDEAEVVITDPLDKGADFVSASYGSVTLSMPDLPAGKTEPGGTITQTGTDTGKPVNGDITISYNPDNRLVTWSFKAKAKAGPDCVVLTIRVNKDAVKTWTYSETENNGAGSADETQKDYEVINRARVEIDNKGAFTSTVENPIIEKEEKKPGEGKYVDVGTPIQYAIHWQNDHDQAADVTVRDRLDMGNKGVNFASAEFVTQDQSHAPMTVKDGETKRDLYGDVSIVFDAANDTVTWKLMNRPANSEGEVILNVVVNENARKPGKVENRAGVQINDENEVLTRVIPNPLGPSKTETHINGNAVTLEPVEGGFRGPTVNENDEVTYRVHWVNNAADGDGNLVDADVTVVDPLDKGVDFVSASVSPGFETEKTLIGEGGTQTGTDERGEWSIAYDAQKRAVTWKLGKRAAESIGDVYLKVRVNSQAVHVWQYGTGEDPTVDDNAKDNEIVDRARVTVSNESTTYTDVYTDVIHNPLISGGLTVTKTVTNGGEMEREFAFRVELSDTKINGPYGDMTFRDGVAEFTLRHGQTKTAKDLPVGTAYKVTEMLPDPNRYTVIKSGDVGTIGEIPAAVTFENRLILPEVPMTGDESRPGLWAALALLCAAATAGTVMLGKRRDDK